MLQKRSKRPPRRLKKPPRPPKIDFSEKNLPNNKLRTLKSIEKTNVFLAFRGFTMNNDMGAISGLKNTKDSHQEASKTVKNPSDTLPRGPLVTFWPRTWHTIVSQEASGMRFRSVREACWSQGTPNSHPESLQTSFWDLQMSILKPLPLHFGSDVVV